MASASGFEHHPALFSLDEARRYRRKIRALFASEKSHSGPWVSRDWVTKDPDFQELIFDPRILRVAREFLESDQICYLQGGDVMAHAGGWNWHRDIPNSLATSVSPFPVVKLGLYFHSKKTGSAIGFLEGTQAQRRFDLEEKELHFWNELGSRLYRFPLTRRFATTGYLRQPMWTGKKVMVTPGAGDVVAFRGNVFHTATDSSEGTYKVFLSYGVPGSASQAYQKHFEENLGYLQPLGNGLSERLSQAKLL